MTRVSVRDFKGEEWILFFRGIYTKSDKGLVETWFVRFLAFGKPKVLPGYETIPVPVFTEWWGE